MSPIKFELEAVCPWSGARAGTIVTAHGSIRTPVFMPVGTNATLKALTFDQVVSCGAEIVLANSYHLYLRPGHKLIKAAGGLHGFMSWQKPILTDSGGFQVFSLNSLRRITEEGVFFKDHRDGKEHFIGPSQSMEIQNALGADIIMAFDDCVKNPATFKEAEDSMHRTHSWLKQCIESHKQHSKQALFGIVQGSMFEELRERSAREVTGFDLPGFAIGGVAVGENRSTIERIIQFTAPLLPESKPRYLMGVGTPWDIAFAIKCGIDMFDCAAPTRLARHGSVFTGQGRVSLRTARFAEDLGPIDEQCQCYTCRHYKKAYLHHLVRSREMAGASLLSIHNITYLIKQAEQCRNAILSGTFRQYFRSQLPVTDRSG